jgi:hypothetical protein
VNCDYYCWECGSIRIRIRVKNKALSPWMRERAEN